jgi:hypothetical protein
MFRIKHMISLGLLLLMLSTMLVFTTGVASAHTTSPSRAAGVCYDTSCDGQNPISMGCTTDARNIYVATTSDLGGGVRATLYLRYSNQCGAAWAQVWFSSMPSGHYGNAWIVQNQGNRRYNCASAGGNGEVLPGQTSCYSAMVGDAQSTEHAWAAAQYWTNGAWKQVATTATW